MRVFFQCVAEAVMENGVKGLADMVPGGKYAYDVAEGAWKKYREKKREQKLHDDVVKLAQASFDEARAEAVRVARAVFAAIPAGVALPEALPDEIIELELYLTAIPDAVRQSLKRSEDPTGTTVPATFSLNSADDVVKLLPPRPPRFRPGMDLPGKPGWVLDRLLGMGGFGEVWFARHARMGSLSGAVKFCLGQSGQDLKHEADLIDRVMSAGRHPNIVPLTDAHLEGASPWLLFEYVGGGSLTDWIHQLAGKPKELRLKQVLGALKQLCEAVGFFHALPVPIVHRDLKPSNILLDRASGRLRITDFGIGAVTAKETNRQESRVQGTRGGRLQSYPRGSHTPLYSSPQQRSGDDADPRDDVHALGVIAYQMLTGHLAQGAGPDFADDLRDSGASEELIALLGKCVAQKPERRPKNAVELLERVQLIQAQEKQQIRQDAEEYERAVLRSESENFLKARAPERFGAWYAAANHGNSLAMVLVGEAFENGFGTNQNHVEAVRWYRKAANLGNSAAMHRFGFAYMIGRGVKQDESEAVRWYQQAADLGYTNAMTALGSAYALGKGGLKKDDAQCLKWYNQAANLGDLEAINYMATFGCMKMAADDLGVDHVEQVRWYRKGADLGDPFAMCELGRALLYGEGAREDHAEGIRLIRRAIDLGETSGMCALGLAYLDGQGVGKDRQEGLQWLQKAVDLGDARTMCELGRVFEKGRGVVKNLSEAIAWYRMALKHGSGIAKFFLDRLGVSE